MKYRQFIREGKRSSTFSSAGDAGMMGAAKRAKTRFHVKSYPKMHPSPGATHTHHVIDNHGKEPNEEFFKEHEAHAYAAARNAGKKGKRATLGEESSGKHGVYLKGGSIGTKHDHSQPVKVHDSKEDADAHAKRMNKLLSPGEKTYYKMRYHVKPVSEDVTEEINEEYHVFSGQTVHSKHGSREDALTHAKPGTEVGKLAKKFKGQRYDEFQGYSHVWDHQGKKRPLED